MFGEAGLRETGGALSLKAMEGLAVGAACLRETGAELSSKMANGWTVGAAGLRDTGAKFSSSKISKGAAAGACAVRGATGAKSLSSKMAND